MSVVTDFPRRVREIENLFIPLADGTRLAARIFLPEDAGQHPVPAILEYLPYRKRDGTAERDALTHPYFAGHGYAGVRVDIRGSGESDGLLDDEYAKQEQDDCVEVIAWLARQPWCSGAVGMIGISWGGFNGLQVAARQPPALKAIITICSTEDRYADDVHFMGGALLNAKLGWASTFFAFQTRPPDPALVGERWRAMWLERLEALPLFMERWLRHQRRDDYWKHGSVAEDFSAIVCPVYAVGGWTDGYSNAIPRLLAGLSVPRKGLIGPWAHRYPHFALPGPQIGFLQEALRWWDFWLKGIDTGIMAEPMLRAWVMESVRPSRCHAERPGRWVAEPGWPRREPPRRLAITRHGLDAADTSPAALPVASAPETGLQAGSWCPFGGSPDDADDQRPDDANSIVFDTQPLDARVEILGAPVVEIALSCDRPNGLLAVRLCDVHPDGASLRVSYGLLNLSHRESHACPEPLVPGRRYHIRLALNDIGHAFPPGHRIRLAVSSAYWPIAWPLPANLTLHLPGALLLPVRAPQAADESLPPFPPPHSAPPEKRSVLRTGSSERVIIRDLDTRATVMRNVDDAGLARIDAHGLELGSERRASHVMPDGDPLGARAEVAWTLRVGRGAWQTRTETRTVFTADAENFLLRAELDAYEGDSRVCSRNWHYRIRRDMM